jgi:effector-binding domain-containing protein
MIDIVDVAPGVIAGVRRKAAWGELSAHIRAGLDQVWPVLRAAGVAVGYNIVVYRDARSDGCDLEIGVELRGPFTPAGGVEPMPTPSGRAIHYAYVGPYSGLGVAHDAIIAYAKAHGYAAAPYWEVYGDWAEDASQLRTDVYRLIP